MKHTSNNGKVLISVELIDNFVPTSVTCMSCQSPLDLILSHFGRMIVGFISTVRDGIIHKMRNGKVIQIPTFEEKFFPKKVSGEVCNECFITLYNTTWRDKNGHLRRAFEPKNKEIIQPKNDDYEASSITKGLYAPHATKRKGRVNKALYLENATNEHTSPVIEESMIKRENLVGFSKKAEGKVEIGDELG